MANKLLVFTSPTCGPCRQLKPNLEKLQGQFKFDVQFHEHGDESSAAAFSIHGVRQVPFVVGVNAAGERQGAFFGAQALPIVEKHLRDWGVIV